MSNDILLSIIIPTFNRVSFLETTVNCFVDQIKADRLESAVEVIIGNNASEDATSAFVNNIKAQYDFINGFNHPRNLGFSKNVEFLLKEARGKHILICGDDDLLRNGAIAYILKCIEEKKPNFILINTSNILSLDNANRDFKIILENRLKISKNIFMENFQRDRGLLKPARNWLYLTNFITAVVFKKDLFEAELVNARQYIRPENTFAFQGPIIIGISKYGKLLVIAECFVLHRKTEPNWIDENAQAIFFMDLFYSTEISVLIKKYMPDEYKKYKKLYATFIMEEFMIEIKRKMKIPTIRKFAWIAFCKNFDCFPENIKFLSMVAAPKLITRVAPRLQAYKKLINKMVTYIGKKDYEK